MKIAISAPHTPSRPGAGFGIVTEYGLGSAVVGDLVFRLQKAGHEAWLIGAGNNRVQIADINKLGVDCGLELHFNSFSVADMSGTEVLHAGSKRGVSLAECIQKALLEKLRTKDRGIKMGHHRGDVRKPIIEMLKDTNCPFVVPEPLFLSNPDDYSRIDIPAISIALFEGLEGYSQKLIP
ncbi:MAG: N-acetylmuramoyl-L-alanine amidase [Deltaproteobacteria bacterium]|jgi:N-acetylmuramoyl-L-alanine amidase|nr:N-acetylmuramoyl-L-alanine amidase [Deltaproteobacteria bacterium]MBT7892285.1 N-acetylmuramoyl-L-alanine amidase [Deltaproteobacteria bacterium]